MERKMKENNLPSVGIGLPVYNNSKYLSKTLDSLINQTYPNITIFLSDDFSNDGTDKICELYAKKDNRIKYSRNEKNIRAMANNRKVSKNSLSFDYFMFARGHEILTVNLIEECVNILEEEEDTVLAFATPIWIDEDDKIIDGKYFCYYDTRGLNVMIRVAFALWGKPEYFYGLFRSEVLKDIDFFNDLHGQDAFIVLSLALRGYFAHAINSVRYRRYLYSTETFKKRIKRYRKGTFSRVRRIDRIFRFARFPYYLCKAVLKSNISLIWKIKVLIVVIATAPLRYLASRKEKL